MEEKRNMRQATLLGLAAILAIIVVIVLGIPLLIRMAVFLGDIKSSSRPVEKNDLIPPVPPQISLPYSATNSASQTISGSAEPGSSVFLTLNGESVGNVIAAEDGGFSISNIHLTVGDNKLSAVAIDQAGNKSMPANEIDVFYSNKPPKLDISSPTDRQQISNNKVEISGSVDEGSRLVINDRFIVIAPNGKFNVVWNLNSGENGLVFVATDQSGNQTRKELIVTATP